MYYIVFSILAFFSIVELVSSTKNKYVFNFAYLLMTLMAMFRYGQFADYFNYEILYDNPDQWGAFRDPLYFVVVKACKMVGIDYTYYVMILGVLTMRITYSFFSEVCEKSIISLLVYYCYAFLILPMSAMRQGLCLALLLWSYTYLVNQRKTLFYSVVLVASLIHFSMIFVFVLGMFYDKKWFNDNLILYVVIGLTFFAIFTPDLSTYIPELLSDRSASEYEDSRLIQVAIRASLIFPVMFVKPPYGSHGYFAKSICIIGYCLYCFFSFSSIISGRLEFYFRTFLCLYVAYIVFYDVECGFGGRVNSMFGRKGVLCIIVAVHSVLFFKNMYAAIDQCGYNTQKVTMFDFPYISIFDKNELEKYK